MMISKDTQDMSSAQRTAGVTKKVLGVEMIVVLSQLLMSAKWLVEKAGCFAPVERLAGKIVTNITRYKALSSTKPFLLLLYKKA